MSFRVKEIDTLSQYDVSIKKYKDGTHELKLYDRKIMYQRSGFEEVGADKVNEVKSKVKNHCNQVESDRGIRKDNLTRSYSLLVDLTMNNVHLWKSFITLTFAENIQDLDKANYEFKKFVIKVKYQYKDFSYIAVPEFQKRGAVHYHLLTNLDPISHTNIIKLQDSKENMYDVIQWVHGFTSVFDLSLADDKFSVSAYMSKYFFKDIDNRLFNRRKILYSNNLEKPKVVKYDANSQEFINYMNYLHRNAVVTKEKSIITDNNYAPNMHILLFSPK